MATQITDGAGNLVAEFCAPSPEATERVIEFWRAQMSGEPLTIDRNPHATPRQWTESPAALEAYSHVLPWLTPELPGQEAEAG